ASWSGSIMDRRNLGAKVSPTDVLLKVANFDRWVVEAKLNESDVLDLKTGMEAVVIAENSPTVKLPGEIENISIDVHDALMNRDIYEQSNQPSENPTTTYTVRIRLSDPDLSELGVVSGTRAKVRINDGNQSLFERIYARVSGLVRIR
ncbi:MAG: HlyD family secretion protein, partial [Planctomycetota bacterium]